MTSRTRMQEPGDADPGSGEAHPGAVGGTHRGGVSGKVLG